MYHLLYFKGNLLPKRAPAEYNSCGKTVKNRQSCRCFACSEFKEGDKKKKDDPLVNIKNSLKPGFKAMARMPYISIDNINYGK